MIQLSLWLYNEDVILMELIKLLLWDDGFMNI